MAFPARQAFYLGVLHHELIELPVLEGAAAANIRGVFIEAVHIPAHGAGDPLMSIYQTMKKASLIGAIVVLASVGIAFVFQSKRSLHETTVKENAVSPGTVTRPPQAIAVGIDAPSATDNSDQEQKKKGGAFKALVAEDPEKAGSLLHFLLDSSLNVNAKKWEHLGLGDADAAALEGNLAIIMKEIRDWEKSRADVLYSDNLKTVFYIPAFDPPQRDTIRTRIESAIALVADAQFAKSLASHALASFATTLGAVNGRERIIEIASNPPDSSGGKIGRAYHLKTYVMSPGYHFDRSWVSDQGVLALPAKGLDMDSESQISGVPAEYAHLFND